MGTERVFFLGGGGGVILSFEREREPQTKQSGLNDPIDSKSEGF